MDLTKRAFRITIFKSPPDMDEYDMYKVFGQFGEIYDVSKQSPQEIHIDFAKVTDDRINRVEYKITLDGREFSFRFNGYQDYYSARSSKQRNVVQRTMAICKQLKTAPAAASPNNILSVLNDHCLLKIFHQLNLSELCDVANVCQRFNGIAKKVFEVKYKNRPSTLELSHGRGKLTPLSLHRIGLCLETFGSEIKEFYSVSTRLNRTIILGMYADYCPKLILFWIRDYAFDDGARKYVRRLLSRAKELKLIAVDTERTKFQQHIVSVNNLFATESQSMHSLEVLNIQFELFSENDMHDKFSLIKDIFHLPSLNELKLSNITKLTERMLDILLLANPRVRKIYIRNVGIPAHILQLLPRYLPNVEEVYMHRCSITNYTEDSVIDWGSLKCLKSLKLTWFAYNYCPRVRSILKSLALNKVPVQSLILIMKRFEGDIDVLEYVSHMDKLEKLNIGGIPGQFRSYDQIKGFLRNLNDLKEVVFEYCYMEMSSIKANVRQVVQLTNAPISITYNVHPGSEVIEKDCAQIGELLGALPDTNVMINARNQDVDADTRRNPPSWLKINSYQPNM